MLRQTFEALFARNHGARTAFGLVGRIQILQGVHLPGGFNGSLKLTGQFALFFDGFEDGGATLVDQAQADDLIGNNADLLVVECAGHFLAVAGNKGNGVALIKQMDGGLHLGGFNMQLGGDRFGVIHRVSGELDWREILPYVPTTLCRR